MGWLGRPAAVWDVDDIASCLWLDRASGFAAAAFLAMMSARTSATFSIRVRSTRARKDSTVEVPFWPPCFYWFFWILFWEP